jgi:tetratricopeptide (TPR) repeat protein
MEENIMDLNMKDSIEKLYKSGIINDQKKAEFLQRVSNEKDEKEIENVLNEITQLLKNHVSGIEEQKNELKDDNHYLNAPPVSEKLNVILWLTPEQLSGLGSGFTTQRKIVTLTIGTTDYEITQEEYALAKSFEKIVDKAIEAGNNAIKEKSKDKMEESIRYYKQALELAPGHDMILANIGLSYMKLIEYGVNRIELSKRYLTRAGQVSYNKKRLKRFLEQYLDPKYFDLTYLE